MVDQKVLLRGKRRKDTRLVGLWNRASGDPAQKELYCYINAAVQAVRASPSLVGSIHAAAALANPHQLLFALSNLLNTIKREEEADDAAFAVDAAAFREAVRSAAVATGGGGENPLDRDEPHSATTVLCDVLTALDDAEFPQPHAASLKWQTHQVCCTCKHEALLHGGVADPSPVVLQQQEAHPRRQRGAAAPGNHTVSGLLAAWPTSETDRQCGAAGCPGKCKHEKRIHGCPPQALVLLIQPPASPGSAVAVADAKRQPVVVSKRTPALSLADARYRLVAVLNHHEGSVGHHTADVLDNKNWFRMDDEKVQRSTQLNDSQQFERSDACALVYEKQPISNPAAKPTERAAGGGGGGGERPRERLPHLLPPSVNRYNHIMINNKAAGCIAPQRSAKDARCDKESAVPVCLE